MLGLICVSLVRGELVCARTRTFDGVLFAFAWVFVRLCVNELRFRALPQRLVFFLLLFGFDVVYWLLRYDVFYGVDC